MTANCRFQTLETTEDGLALDLQDTHLGFIVEPELSLAYIALNRASCRLIRAERVSPFMADTLSAVFFLTTRACAGRPFDVHGPSFCDVAFFPTSRARRVRSAGIEIARGLRRDDVGVLPCALARAFAGCCRETSISNDTFCARAVALFLFLVFKRGVFRDFLGWPMASSFRAST